MAQENKLNHQMNSDLKIKVFILYLLANIDEPLDLETISEIVLQGESKFVFPLEFHICFAKLLEIGQIVEDHIVDSKVYYRISEDGKTALQRLETDLVRDTREIALRSARRIINYNKTGARILTNIEEAPGGFYVICSIVDNKKTIMKSEIFVTDENFAHQIKANFINRAESILKGTLALLSGDVNFIFDE